MKNLSKFFLVCASIIVTLFAVSNIAQAQATNFWLLKGNNLAPISNNWGLTVPSLANLSCIGTNGSGVFGSGTCSGGGGAWPFTTTDTNFGVAVQSTTTPEWFKNGVFASSTSQFVYASTTAVSATTICFLGDVCRTTWPTASSGTGNVSTSSAETAGQLAYWTTTAGTPAKLGTVATSSVSATSPLTGSLTVIGSGGSIGIQAASASQAGSMAAVDYSRLYAATTTFSAPLSYSNTTNAVTCPTCVLTSSSVNTTYPLQGGGALSGDLTLTTAFSTTTNTGIGNNLMLYTSAGGVLKGVATSSAGIFTGTQTNGFVLGLSGGVPTWVATSSSAGGISWPWTVATNFGTTTNSTTTGEWFKQGLYASSTSQFVYASTTQLSASNSLCINGDCRTAWPSSSAPGGSQNNIQYKSGSSLAGSQDFQWDDTNKILSIATSSNVSATIQSGSYLNIQSGGDGTGVNIGGTSATTPGGNGGFMEFFGGNGLTSGNGGTTEVDAGAGGATGSGGFSIITGGSSGSTGAGNGGDVELIGGYAGGDGSNSGRGGNINLIPGLIQNTGSGSVGKTTFFYDANQAASVTLNVPSSGTYTATYPSNSGTFALGSYSTGFAGGFIPYGSAGLLATSSRFSFDGAALQATYASTTQLSATSLCLTGDTCRTTWPTSGGGGSGNVATSSGETDGQIPYWTTTNGTPAKLGSVATGTLTISSPLTGGPFTIIGTGGSVGLDTSGTWTGSAGSVGHSHSPDGTTITGTAFNGSATVSDWAIKLSNGNVWTAASTTFTGHLAINTSSSTQFSSATIWDSTVGNALWLGDSNGKATAYGGASSCSANNFFTGLSATGASSCGTASISGVNLGGNLAAHTTNTSLSGTSYNGSAAVSDWGINLSHGNTWTALQQFSSAASTSQFSVQGGTAWFGGSATSSFNNAGVLTLASALTVANGGTGAGTLTGCLTGNGTNPITGSGTCNTSNATVSSIATNNGVTGGTITTTGTLSLDQTFGAVWTPASTTFTQHISLNSASSTQLSSPTIWNSTVGNALWLGDATGKATAFGGSSGVCTNQFPTSLSAVGALGGCTSVADAFFSGQLGIAHGGTNASLSGANQVLFMNSGNTAVSSDSKFLFSSVSGAHTIGTTTSAFGTLTLGSSTLPQVELSDNSGGNNWFMRWINNTFYMGTSTVSATSTGAAAISFDASQTGGSLSVGSSTPTFPAANGLVTIGGKSITSGSTTISTGQVQIDGYNTSGTRVCVFVVGTTLTVGSGACTQ